jgi:rod shape-determining protein MreC
MWSLLRYFQRHHVAILFIILEIISLYFLFSRNNFQRAAYMNSANHISGTIYERYNSIVNYFRLSTVNRELSEENARLRRELGSVALVTDSSYTFLSATDSNYTFIPARVINNSVNRQYNYLTLNKGSKDGIRPEMGVSTVHGVVGMITNVSESYSTAISLLNLRWNVSAKLKRNNYFGSLSWDGKDYRHALLNEIPFHVDLEVGDTIVTSGFSSIFPEGYMLGVIDSFNKEGGDNFYTIRIKLSVDFKSLVYVEVIGNSQRKEIESLERLNTDGSNLD